MKRSLALLLACMTLTSLFAACGPGANKVTIGKPGGGPPDDRGDEKTSQPLPSLADDDLRLVALEELTRIYRSSKILIDERNMENQTSGCISYKRVDTDNQFLRAEYKDCHWNRDLAGSSLKWVLAQGVEFFSANQNELNSRFKANLSVQFLAATPERKEPLNSLADTPTAAGKRRDHRNTYIRGVKITLPKASSEKEFGLSSVSGIGIFEQTKVDYWMAYLKGHWKVQEKKIESGNFLIEIAYRQASRSKKANDLVSMTLSPRIPITFEGKNCSRPKGSFIWSKYVAKKLVDSGSFDVDSGGLVDRSETPTGKPVIPWPKSCLEYPPEAFE